MCNCKNTDGFKQKLAEAKKSTEETGETYVVYAKEVPGHGKHVFVCKESALTDELGICCYFLSNGKEVIYTLKNVEDIEVSEPIVVKKTKKTKKDVKIISEVTAENPTETESSEIIS